MFSTLGLFNKVPCPVGSGCELVHCIFAHENWADQNAQFALTSETPKGPPNKKIKFDHPSDTGSSLTTPSSHPFMDQMATNLPTPPNNTEHSQPKIGRTIKSDVGSVRTGKSRNSISPPPSRRPVTDHDSQNIPRKVKRSAPDAPNAPDPKKPVRNQRSESVEILNPRMITKPPAPHTSRTLYLKKLHGFMTRLNDLARKSDEPSVKDIALSDNDLVKLALTEEECLALENFSVYSNMIKLRMLAISKMSLEQWKAERSTKDDHGSVTSTAKSDIVARDLSTGLSSAEEMQILPYLLADQKILAPHGLVITPPTEAEIKTALEGVEMSHGYEKCDRCGSRFQVFPERREDGALTSGGSCTYHYGRIAFPDKNGLNFDGLTREKRYSCCNEPIGSEGCVTFETHVFKVSDKKRLASILQFERTPDNPRAPRDRAVSFDCEMGYTVYGMEMIRLTAVAWPTNEEILDVLVRPLGAILDLNTRFSGVSSKDFASANPLGSVEETMDPASADKRRLTIVDSPVVARDLFFKLISPSTPLIGHAIDNDLTVTRVIHPTIIDTVVLYPHRSGLPFRPALRILAKERLRREIQTGGAAGHDSKEDAIATGDLVRLMVGKTWQKMSQAGWKFEGGKLIESSDPSYTQHTLRDFAREEIQSVKGAEVEGNIILEY